MNTANDALAESVDAVRAELDRAWRRDGVRLADRQEMIEDIVSDLRAAAQDGRDPRSVLGIDVPAFARQVADARAVQRVRPAHARMFLAALAGSGAAFTLGLPPALALFDGLLAGRRSDGDNLAIAALCYGLLALACLSAALAGVALALRGAGAVGATLWRAALLVPVAGLVVTPLTMLFASLTGYSTNPSIVSLEAGLVLGAGAAALAAARHWALRRATG